MKKVPLFIVLIVSGLCVWFFAGDLRSAQPATKGPEWSMNATAIEACSCPMFCQCYFNTAPAGHHDMKDMKENHFCRANLAYKINHGTYGTVKLDGAKFWIASDLGGDFSKGQMEWAVLTFDKATTKEQREAIGVVAGKLFPVKWNSFTTAEGDMNQWEITKDGAVALLDNGKSGEVRLTRFKGLTPEPVVVKNLPYWGAKRNDGFILAPNTIEAYRVGPKAFEFKGSNGFMITIDMKSSDYM